MARSVGRPKKAVTEEEKIDEERRKVAREARKERLGNPLEPKMPNEMFDDDLERDAGIDAKRLKFLTVYMQTFSARKAALAIGVPGGIATWKGAQLLQKDVLIRERVQEWLQAISLDRQTIIGLLEQQARALHTDYIRANGTVDLGGLKKANLMHLVKSVTPTKEGTKVEFVDSQAALMFLARVYKVVEELPPSTTQQVIIVLPDNGRDSIDTHPQPMQIDVEASY